MRRWWVVPMVQRYAGAPDLSTARVPAATGYHRPS
jgi:hypothetical protein